MTYEFNLVYALWALGGLVLGLLIGNATWGRSARRNARIADSVGNAAATAAARTQAEHSARELAAVQASMRPLADEVDRLKRDLARARPVPTALPLTNPLPDALADDRVVPAKGVAGTGPIVVDPVPGIRQLKGVGDKFAAALEGVGLSTVDRIARLNADEASDADTRLGSFNGRIAKDRLVEQAVLLDEGRMTEFETRFGKL